MISPARNLLDTARSIQGRFGPSDVPVLSTYFTSRADPQENTRQDRMVVRNNDESYLAAWYGSVREHGLRAIVLHDDLAPEFVQRFETEDIRFLRCSLGSYSLNDERFFLYLDLLRGLPVRGAFATDISDVTLGGNPAKLLERRARIFVGRDRWDKIRCSDWMRSKLDESAGPLGLAGDSRFLEQPLFNAGVLGGRREDLIAFLTHMTEALSALDNDRNHNMVALNLVLYRHYFGSAYRFKPFTGQTRTNPACDPDASVYPISSGFPVCSEYKAYQVDSEAIFRHK